MILDLFIYTCSIIFGICIAFLMLVSEIFNITYETTCVYINLYLQYSIILLSSFSVLYVSVKKLSKKFKLKRLFNCLFSIIYNYIFIFIGYKIYMRYGVIETNAAFNLCKKDLFSIVQTTDYGLNWIGYYIINVLIFIVLFLFIIFFNRLLRKCINKYL